MKNPIRGTRIRLFTGSDKEIPAESPWGAPPDLDLTAANSNRSGQIGPQESEEGGQPRRSLWRRDVSRAGIFLIACCLVHFAALRLAPRAWGLPSGATLSAILHEPMVLIRRNADGKPAAQCACALPVADRDIPQHLRDALVAIEDRRFFVHSGVDWRGLLRAGIVNLAAGGRVEGGSTVTQQLAKTIVGSQRTLTRKLRELVVAKEIEARYSKREILDLYLNRVYFGRNVWGIEDAARIYFHKHARDLSVLESAMLVGMLQAPAVFDPERHPQAARGRARIVLHNMVLSGALTRRQAELALAAPIRKGRVKLPDLADGYYLAWIERRVAALVPKPGDGGGEWRVSIALDPRRQIAAERAVRAGLAAAAPLSAHEAALISMDRSGLVRALIGGGGYGGSQFDRATQAVRQPGSAYKIAVYLAALKKGYKPSSTVLDEPITIDGWSPRNDDGRFRGRITLTDALAASRNAATVRLASEVGFGRVAEMARRLGLPYGATPSFVLGTQGVRLIDLTAAYATIANGGRRVEPDGVVAILDRHGEVVYRRDPEPGKRVVSARDAAEIAKMLRAVVREGTGMRARLGVPVAGKTGTTQDDRDAWFIGFTGDLVTGVWYGNDDSSPTKVSGGTLPAETWRAFTQAALEGKIGGARR